MQGRMALAFERFDRAELKVCRYLNQSSSKATRQLFRAVSWLGDGWVWYGLMLSLPWLHGGRGVVAAVHMALTGAVALPLYKAVKGSAVRERPFITHSVIECVSAPMDRYSFPSGHTLHAVAFTLLAVSYFPEWAGLLSLLVGLIALSRVILGLHYPTDVAAGAVLGGIVGATSLELGRLLSVA
jgi:undecaprenyl-diphosphatase